MPPTPPRHDLVTPPAERVVGQQRQRVLEILKNASAAVDAQQVADALQLHVTTARFHLTALEERGAIRRRRAPQRGRAGRPRVTYEVAPRLDYADIVALFATHLGGTADEREQRAVRIGADLAHRVRLARVRDETNAAELVVATLQELGFQVRSVLNSFGELTVGICTCPLAEVARTAPEVVRGIQAGLIQEVIDLNAERIGGRYRAAVTPDPHAGSCEVSLSLRPAGGS